jgi:hypothetical protein
VHALVPAGRREEPVDAGHAVLEAVSRRRQSAFRQILEIDPALPFHREAADADGADKPRDDE